MSGRTFASVGYQRLPSNVREGSRAAYGKEYTRYARESMAQVIHNYNMLIAGIHNILPEVLVQALHPTFKKSQEYCPIKTGALRESGTLRVNKGLKQPRAEISYGGKDIFYAAIVHERTDLNHKSPTRAKFLQSAMEEDAGEYRGRVVALINGGLVKS